MKIKDVIWTPKMQAVMNDDAQVIYLVGATGCSKSLVAGFKVFDRILNAPEEKRQFYMVFKDLGTATRNFLDNEDTFYNIFNFLCEKYKATKVGGLQFKIKGIHGDKFVYIAGANDKQAWSKVLGSNPDGIWLEEMSVLHIDLIREVMGRTISRNCWLIGTTNGGMPNQEFYTEFVNHAVVQFPETVPSAEMNEMIQDKPYAHYYHFNLVDDAPHMTPEQKANLIELYPEKSFYYMSKIMGCRGFMEGAAFAQLMDKETHLVEFDRIELNNLQEINLYVDVGSNLDPSDTSKASTIASLVGYSKNCQRIVVLECWEVPATSHDDIIKFCEERCRWWWIRHMVRFKKIVIDSAEAILINTWKNKNKFNTVQVKGSVKAYRDIINLRSRCELKQQLLMQKRLLWTTHALNNYHAHTRLLMDEDGSVLDLGIQDNDINDTIDYALTEKWNDITKNVYRE